jgi:hypothetical protein
LPLTSPAAPPVMPIVPAAASPHAPSPASGVHRP